MWCTPQCHRKNPGKCSSLCQQNSPVAQHLLHLTTFLLTESLMLPVLVFACKQKSGGQYYGQTCQMESKGELCTCLCVEESWSIVFFPPLLHTVNMRVEIRSNGFEFACINVPGHQEHLLWMSVFLFSYGHIQLIECRLSASIGLRWCSSSRKFAYTLAKYIKSNFVLNS